METKKIVWNNFNHDFVSPEYFGINLCYINDIRSYLLDAIKFDLIPGAVLCIGYKGSIIMHEAFGRKQVVFEEQPMEVNTIFDIASLTKIIATWASIMKLATEGKLQIFKPIKYYLDICKNLQIGDATLANLLTHTAGLPERTYLKKYGFSYNKIIEGICKEPLVYNIGTNVLYCDRGFILLGKIIEVVSGQTIDCYVKKYIWEPLGMSDTCFNPPLEIYSRVAPTEYRNEIGKCQKGTVHDENAAWLGGIAGHAGVFSTSKDLASFCAMILGDGLYNGMQIIDSELIHTSLNNQTEALNSTRGYGWVQYEERPYSSKIFGHLGFTGTSMWLDRNNDIFVILLTNRVHPDRQKYTTIKQVRAEVRRRCWRLLSAYFG